MRLLSKISTSALLAIIFIFVSGCEASDKERNLQVADTKRKAVDNNTGNKPKASSGPLVWPPPSVNPVEPAANPMADNYLVVFDGSGSMLDRQCSGALSKDAVAKEAVKKFAEKLSETDNLGLLAFDHQGGLSLRAPLRAGARDPFFLAVDNVRAGGRTPLVKSLVNGYKVLLAQAQAQGGYGSYNLIVITDGASSDGDPSRPARKIVNRSAIRIHVIGFCVDSSHSLNVPGYTTFTTASNPEALYQGLADVLAESEEFDPTEFVKQ